MDGGVSDNVAMRGVIDALNFLESLHDAGLPSTLDHAQRIVIFIVNSLSARQPTGMSRRSLRAAAGTIIQASPEVQRLLKDTGAKIVPIPASAAPAASPATQ